MARTKISEFSATAADNTDIDNIDIAEGCAPSGINNAIREMMAQLKDFQTGAAGDSFNGPVNGALNGSLGATTPNTVVATQVDITAQGDLRLQDTTGGQYVALQAPGTVASSYTLTLPVDDGTAGQALITDGSGVLSWSSAASGDVYGPASATDNAVARYDGTTGKLIQNSAVTIADDGATVIDANSTTNALRITQTGTGNALLVEDSANPDATPFVVNADGNVIIGGTTALGTGLSLVNSGSFTPVITSRNTTADSGYTYADFQKSRAGAIVQSGDGLGGLIFSGFDGAAQRQAGSIVGAVDGTPGTNDMPGRLVFSTTADGASSPTERMRIDNAGRVGIGATPNPGATLHLGKNITGASSAYGTLNNATIQSDVTTLAQIYRSSVSTAAAAFTLTSLSHFYATQGTIGATSTVTNQYGYFADSTITGATNNYGFYGNIPVGTGRWNLYMAGTAGNYMAGGLQIANTGQTALQVTGGANIGTSASTTALRSYSAANWNFANTDLIRNASNTATPRFLAFALDADDLASTTIGGYNAIWGIYNAAPTTGSTSVALQGEMAYASFYGHRWYINGTERARIASTGTISLGAAPGAESLRVTPVASAVNYINAFGGATGNVVSFAANGSDTNIGIAYTSKGNGIHDFFSNNYGSLQFRIAHTASAVNYLQATGGATGNAATLSAQGSDTNIDLNLTPKGTGNVRFGTHTASADVAISGYIEIKDAAGNIRKLAVIS